MKQMLWYIAKPVDLTKCHSFLLSLLDLNRKCHDIPTNLQKISKSTNLNNVSRNLRISVNLKMVFHQN